MNRSLGQALDALAATIEQRASEGAAVSYTAALLQAGPAKCAKKLGEEGVEAALAGVSGDAAHLTAEAADVLFHLLVLLRACGVPPEAVAAELQRRSGQSGLEEKQKRGSCRDT